jgi:lipoprotein-anchoring transpeptidase ErfK/SrfK
MALDGSAHGDAQARPAKVGTGFASGRAPNAKPVMGRGHSMRVIGLAAAAAIAAATFGAAPVAAREVVAFRGDVSAGTVVVRTSERRLYYVVGDGRAIRYPVGVGKAGKQWAGTTTIDGKYLHPAWSPPSEVKRDKPNMPDVIPGGSPRNPMGVAAMTLAGGEYAIHGTNVPGSVGGFVSYGCIRMLNDDISDLYQRVSVGTTVTVTH